VFPHDSLELYADSSFVYQYQSTAFDMASTKEVVNLLFSKLKITAKRKSLHFEKDEILDLTMEEPAPPGVASSESATKEPAEQEELDRYGTLKKQQSYQISQEIQPFTIVDFFFAPPARNEEKDRSPSPGSGTSSKNVSRENSKTGKRPGLPEFGTGKVEEEESACALQ
jgi:hypothetical protein